jgi:aryl-alcohol dehydrogenase-like predicted oxidoreductase
MDNLYSRIGIGTANWGKEYNGHKVPEDEQKRILDWCKGVGIHTIDTATAYDWDYSWIWDGFLVYLKATEDDGEIDESEYHCLVAHNAPDTLLDRLKYKGASLYSPTDKYWLWPGGTVQIPYSLYDRRFEPYMYLQHETGTRIHVRSVFLRGKILDKTTPQECIKFVLSNPHVDKVIIGVDSLDQLKENLSFIEEWNALEEKDLDIIDPRRWNE